MADFGQDDEVVSKPSVAAPIASKSSWGQDDEVISKPKTTALGAGSASALEAAAATPGVLAGAAMAQKIPQPTWARPVTGIVGGFVGGYLANQGITSLEGVFDKVFNTKVVDTRKAQQEEHPVASTVGSVAGGGLNPFMRPSIPASVKQAVVGGGIMGAAGAAQRAVMGEKVLDPTAVAIDVGVGMFTKPTKLGERILGHGTPADKPKDAPDTKPPKPTASSTPEEKAAFVKRMDEIKTQRDSVAPLEQAAIRNTETGNIELMGPKHDQARKDAIKGDATYEEGFVDSRGNFHERQAAVEQAKRSNQIPKDHVLESPEGERPGLHSGDLRKANDPRFAITEDQPAGVAKPPSDKPKTRAEHFKDVTDLEHKLYVEEGKVEGDAH